MNSIGSGSGKGRPPPVPKSLGLRAPPPIPEDPAEDSPAESTNPSIRTVEREQQMLLRINKSFYPEDLRVGLNGNAKPALKIHVDQMRDRIAIDMEAETRYFFIIPIRWVAAAATVIALASGGLAIHSCMNASEAKEQIELQKKEIQELKKQLEQQKPKHEPKKTESYIPKALKNPPAQVSAMVPQRIARNSLHS